MNNEVVVVDLKKIIDPRLDEEDRKEKLESIKIPRYAHDSDFGLDLVATEKKIVYSPYYVNDILYIEYRTGIAFDFSKVGGAILITPRSSIRDKQLIMTNSPGIIDSGYQGEIVVCFRLLKQNALAKEIYEVGDKIAQCFYLPKTDITFVEVDEFKNKTERGTSGHGSTGK